MPEAQIARDYDWERRERTRLADGTYKPLPWKDEGWWRAYQRFSHYAHISSADPSLLAYTENEEKGQRDIQTRVKPGRYLRRFFHEREGEHYKFLNDKQIAFYAEWFAKGEKPQSEAAKGAELLFARTPDEIESVYEEGPHSCMSGSAAPRVYGAGDLAIAYLRKEGRAEGEVIARALCWPAKRVYGRIYPNSDYWATDNWSSEAESAQVGDALETHLRALGYVSYIENIEGQTFEGARILCEAADRGRDTYTMPYFDGRWGVKWNARDGFIMTKRYEFACAGTDGYIEALPEPEGYCAHCATPLYAGDETHEINGTWVREEEGEGFWEDCEEVCPSCFSAAHVCEYTGQRFLNSRVRLDGLITQDSYARAYAARPLSYYRPSYGAREYLSLEAQSALKSLFLALGRPAPDPNQLNLELEAA